MTTKAPAAAAAKGLRAPGKYRVLREFVKYPKDDGQLADVMAGERPDVIAWRYVYQGEIAADYPACSVAGDLAAGVIVEANGASDPYAKPAAPVAAGGDE